MLCVHGVVLWLETSPTLKHSSVPYQYQSVAALASLIFMNSLACRVFRLLRQLSAEDRQCTWLRDAVSSIAFRLNIQRGLDTR